MERVKNEIVEDFREISYLIEILFDLTDNKRVNKRLKEIKKITNKYR
ncbi:hypothetical protein [Clostridium sporogenes]|nr:hypothetical protein [Clostridium sporogenes]EJP6471384.1 hypothetical protein [Clostridium botulinum]EHN17098.1 hypothetical protein IYC_00335 [Clostridium sporogenes PA 3679]KRU46314.1 hypothetical protein VT94_04880 [Clostridium sporogenes]MBY7064389.1 hypothetical protein [Clostridium sporogenes]MBY7071353.1 hypothetical protein [Clostridium sporogenes]